MDYKTIIQDAEKFVRQYIQTYSNMNLYYHNMEHMRQMVEATIQIGIYYNLSENERFIVTLAAYFHDIGYYMGSVQMHEVNSALLAESFLKKYAIAPYIMVSVKNCILATRIPQIPRNLLEKIVCDADLYYLGSDSFEECNRLLHQETSTLSGMVINASDWRKKNIDLLKRHQFHTDYANLFFKSKKNAHLIALTVAATKADWRKITSDLEESSLLVSSDPIINKQNKKQEKKKGQIQSLNEKEEETK